MKRKLVLIIGLLYVLIINNTLSADIKIFPGDGDEAIAGDSAALRKGRLITVISASTAAYAGSMAYLQYIYQCRLVSDNS